MSDLIHIGKSLIIEMNYGWGDCGVCSSIFLLKAIIVISICMISELSDRPLGRIFLFLNFALMEMNDEKNCVDDGNGYRNYGQCF